MLDFVWLDVRDSERPRSYENSPCACAVSNEAVEWLAPGQNDKKFRDDWYQRAKDSSMVGRSTYSV